VEYQKRDQSSSLLLKLKYVCASWLLSLLLVSYLKQVPPLGYSLDNAFVPQLVESRCIVSNYICSRIWEEWTLIWTIRNQVIHGHNQTSRLNIQRFEAETELRAIYDDRELLLPADQDHLFDDVNTHLAYSTNSIRNWLNTYQGLFTDSISKAETRALDGVRSIRSYFQPA
jgi:hypothetical protein